MAMYINMDRGDYLNNGIAPRQRKVYVLRWNPSISSFGRDSFENYFAQYKHVIPLDDDNKLDWTVWDWENVEHRDLYVMMQVGQEVNGIVCIFFETTVEYMHRIEKTGLMTAERLIQAIPEVDWLHGHSGELISVNSAEKLGLFLVNELKNVEENDDIYFDSFNQKKYVIGDILTFMCPELKKRLLDMGKNNSPDIKDINELMVSVDDNDYSNWTTIEDHLSLEMLNGIMM